MNKEKELINISYFDNQELSIKEHCDMYRKIVREITNILRKYNIKFVLAETEVCKDLQLKLEEKQKIINEMLNCGIFDCDCPLGYELGNEKIFVCENCDEDSKRCWLKYFKNRVKERGKDVNS